MEIENRFNLINEPWIPIVNVGLVSLQQIFTHPEYLALGGNPIQKIALTKLLLAIAQAAYTPIDDQDWAALGSNGLAKKCLAYLDKWHNCFWLYGEKPFLQMPKIVSAKQQSFGAVLPEIATGNTTILSAIQIERVLTDAQKALLIITLMGFALGGKKTDNSIVLTKGYLGKNNQKGKASTGRPGTSIGFKGFLHNFLAGKNLQETFWFNQFTQQQLGQLAIYPNGIGIPPWEKMPEGEVCDIAKSLQASLMGRLIPLSRFCLLAKNGLHYSEGILHLNYMDGVVDPSVAVDFSAKKTRVLWVDSDKRPWRNLTALLSFMSKNANNFFDCYQIRYNLERIRHQSKNIGIWSGGLQLSNNAGEQYISGSDDFVESQVMLKTDWLGENFYSKLEVEINELDKLSKIIYSSTRNFYKNQNMEGDNQAKMANTLFWQLCERKFQELINTCAESGYLKDVRNIFAQYVNKIYDTFCPKETARQLDAWAKCRPNLYKYLN